MAVKFKWFVEKVAVSLLSPVGAAAFITMYYVFGNFIGAALSVIFVFCITELIFYKKAVRNEREKEHTSIDFR